MTSTSSSTTRSCDHCGATGAVLVEMKPGADGQPWFLCVSDWIDGSRPMKCGRIPAKYRNDLEVVSVTEGVAVGPSGTRLEWELTKRWPKGLEPKPKPKKRKAKA